MLRNLSKHWLGRAAVVGVVLAWAGEAGAQSQRASTSNYRSGGMTNNRSSLSNRGGGAPGGGFGQQSAFGQQGGFGQGMQRGGNQGANSAAPGGMVGPTSTGLSEASTDQFQEGGFIGRDAADVEAGFDSTGRERRASMFDTMVENLNELRDSRRRGRDRQNAPPPVRVQLRPAFVVPAPRIAAAAEQADLALLKTLQSRGVVMARVDRSARTLTLRGVAPTAHDRLLAEQMAMLEPGVTQVENLITIAAAP